MRVRLDLLYAGTLPPHHGGSAIAMAQVLSGLALRGHRVRAVGPTTPEDVAAGDPFSARHPELDVHRYVMPFLDTSPDAVKDDAYYDREAQLPVLVDRLVAERRPDLLIAGRESFLPYVARAAAAHELPFVAFAHGSLTHALVAGTYPRERTDSLLAHFREAALVVVPAEHMAASYAGLGVEGVHVVRNPVDLDRFRPRRRDDALAAALGIGGSDIVVAHLSNLVDVKRPLDLAAAAAPALPREPRLRFLVIGDGGMRSELESACASAGVTDRFVFVDWVDFEDVPSYLSLADIVVQPSSAEGQALVYLEAQASGPALVASDIPAAREVVEDGATGLLYPVGDTDRLADAILRAAADPALREAIGARARVAVARHALPDVVVRHEELLYAVVPERPGRSAAATV